ncbi:arsenic transporter [Acidomonas methanolica]|uniref:Arsenical membrane pump protein n=1 Tax=Acidomonas methanolica NBRC 104435 TaxID=1231351 RepID=A0A023D2Z1_ACIMT|nr:arsenic transporter [Acidomonas methanolica]MBU2654788.1 arsenic transporter [Acidomonas methanolica]TCS26453.1 arsenite efflux membrane protein ArsB [Acidomonas methanolica]GAJ28444.1 arsenical membrane pump protein [Acidomonas methanolica NBRC 104435]GBQ51182.1 arsenical membrane pump protein [Acidomonas methanolica]GEK99201.1 arsenic transporter [Acidomonas methanolica NBRC 104435]
MTVTDAIWAIAALATAGVIVRPWRVPEWIWAVAGSVLLVAAGLMPVAAAGAAVVRGLDVYLFLSGMMLLSEAARENGVFDWIAMAAAGHAAGSSTRLFTLVYLAGIAVTALMSNDATAVVLTPAVFAAATRAKADPLPMLFACALIANAASFVLPISNPANIVLYDGSLPALTRWLTSFALPSLGAIVVTYIVLRLVYREQLRGSCAAHVGTAPLGAGGKAALCGILLTALLLVTFSVFGRPLGLPTALAGLATALGVSALGRRSPLALARGVSWGVLPLVAGLFVLVEAVDRTGLVSRIATALGGAARHDAGATALWSGTILAFASNLTNNLPAGLVASTAIGQAHVPHLVVDSLLIGVDLGPNLSITGSLATILWLQAIRREGEDVSFLQFLKLGAIAMPTALAAALGARLWIG